MSQNSELLFNGGEIPGLDGLPDVDGGSLLIPQDEDRQRHVQSDLPHALEHLSAHLDDIDG
jgi:hypothetical protein